MKEKKNGYCCGEDERCSREGGEGGMVRTR